MVRTEAKSLRDLKIGITGCPSPRRGNVATKSGGSRPLETIPDDVEEETPPPQSQTNDEVTSDEVGKQGMSDATLRLMKMVDYLENVQKDGKANLDDSSRAQSDGDNGADDDENEVVGEVDEANELAKLEVDMRYTLSPMSTLGSNNEPILEETVGKYRRSDSTDEYEKSFQASKATLSSAMDFLKELSDHD